MDKQISVPLFAGLIALGLAALSGFSFGMAFHPTPETVVLESAWELTPEQITEQKRRVIVSNINDYIHGYCPEAFQKQWERRYTEILVDCRISEDEFASVDEFYERAKKLDSDSPKDAGTK